MAVNIQEEPAEHNHSGDIHAHNGSDISSDSELENSYETIDNVMENMDAPQDGRPCLRNRYQVVPPIFPEPANAYIYENTSEERSLTADQDEGANDHPQPVQEGDESLAPLGTVASKDYEELNQEPNPNRRDSDDDIDPQPQPVQEGDETLAPLGTVASKDYEELNQESNPNRNDDNDDDGACGGNNNAAYYWDEDRGDGQVEVTPYNEDPMDVVSVIDNSNVNTNIHENTPQEQPIVVDDDEGAGVRDNDDDDVWNEDNGDGQVDETIYNNDQLDDDDDEDENGVDNDDDGDDDDDGGGGDNIEDDDDNGGDDNIENDDDA